MGGYYMIPKLNTIERIKTDRRRMRMSHQIQNLSTLLIQNNAGQQFDIQSQWFMFQRKIVSEIYPDFPNPDTLRIYLYLCKHFDHSVKRCKKSKEAISLDLNYAQMAPGALRLTNYPPEVDAALTWLEDKHFIVRTNRSKHQSYQCRILPVPDYLPGLKDFIGLTNVKYEWDSLKNNNHGYIMVPSKAFDNTILNNSTSVRKKWTDRRLKTLLMLYAHCWLEYFGGVDPRIVSIDSAGTLKLYEGFYYSLKSSEKQVANVIEWFILNGLLKPIKCYYVRDVYFGDVGGCQPPQNHVIKVILRPYYIIQHKLEADIMSSKKSRMIL